MADIKLYVVDLESFGPINVFVQGNLERMREGVVFLTLHDVGSSYQQWVDFVLSEDMEDIRNRSLFLHVSVPGQEPGAEDLSVNFPTLDQMGLNLVTVLDTLRVQQVIGLGEGAGADILTRFGMNHPNRVNGLVAVNACADATQGLMKEKIKSTVRVDESLNFSNVAKFVDAFRKRSEILTQLNGKIKFDYFLIAGGKSKRFADSEKICSKMTPGLCSVLKVDEVKRPLQESPTKVAESLLLFCQGIGLMPTINRRGSRVDSTGPGSVRRPSMSDMDTPNIRRLSLSSCPVASECNS